MWIGVFSAILFGGTLLIAIFLSFLGLTGGRKLPTLQLISLTSFAIFCLFMAWAIIRTGARVDRQGIKTWMLSATREIAWADVEMVSIPIGGSGVPFIGWNIAVVPRKKDGVPQKMAIVPTAFFGNGHLIGKAIIEAAWKANPNVIIDDTLLLTFGTPPYGIFKD